MVSRDDGDGTPPPLHELEMLVMAHLWRAGQATVRDTRDALNAGAARNRAYTTVLTVMTRLHAKGLLDRRRRGRSDVYLPTLTPREYRDRRAAADVDALVARYGDEALVHFARQVDRLDPVRRRRLRRLAQGD